MKKFSIWLENEYYMSPRHWMSELQDTLDTSTLFAAIDNYENPKLQWGIPMSPTTQKELGLNPQEHPEIQFLFSLISDPDKTRKVLNNLWDVVLFLHPDITVIREEHALIFSVNDDSAFYMIKRKTRSIHYVRVGGTTNFRYFNINGFQVHTATPSPQVGVYGAARDAFLQNEPELTHIGVNEIPKEDFDYVYVVFLYSMAMELLGKSK